jgi:ERCC4-type nuclease
MTQKKINKPKMTVIRDTREHPGHGYHFKASANCTGTVEQKLDYGDYTLVGLEDYVVIERKKSIEELCGNFGKNRDRFLREIARMAHVPHKFIVVEDYASSIFKRHFSRMSSSSVLGSITSLMLKHGIYVIFAGNEKFARMIVHKILTKAHDYWIDEQVKKACE